MVISQNVHEIGVFDLSNVMLCNLKICAPVS